MTNDQSKFYNEEDDYDINEEEIDYLDDDYDQEEEDYNTYYDYIDYIQQSYD